MSTLSLSSSPTAVEYIPNGIPGRKRSLASYNLSGITGFGRLRSPTPPMSSISGPPDPIRASVTHLMTRTLSLPCSTAAQAFSQLIQPTMRFQVALDALLPLLEPGLASSNNNQANELPQRILASYILYSLYAPYPITINPFKTALFATFVKERQLSLIDTSASGGPNEQLVWVLWKILKGDGNDIAPYSPNTLARSPLPPKLKAVNLTLSGDELPDDTQPFAMNVDINGTSMTSSRPAVPQNYVSTEVDTHNEELARAMTLLLVAKERVLTLSEQKFLNPLLPALISAPIDTFTNSSNDTNVQSTNDRGILVTSLDLAPIVINNPNIAYSLIVALLSNPPPFRVSVSETPLDASSNQSQTTSPSAASFGTISSDVPQSTPSTMSLAALLAATSGQTHPINQVDLSPTRFLDVLVMLPPTFPSFDLVGKLLRDPTVIPIPISNAGMFGSGDDYHDAAGNGVTLDGQKSNENGNGSGPMASTSVSAPKTTIADLIRTEYLGPFIHSCIEYLDNAEREEKEGRSSEDRWAIGVKHLCRFYQSLIKHNLVDPSSDADSVEMAHFSLRNARFEEAMALYKVFANANSDRVVMGMPAAGMS